MVTAAATLSVADIDTDSDYDGDVEECAQSYAERRLVVEVRVVGIKPRTVYTSSTARVPLSPRMKCN